jgi:hypothetical protein
MRMLLSVITVSWLMMPGVLQAQDTTAVLAPGIWSGYGGSWGHASTAEEGMARGMADMTRSAGMANLLNSEAAINMQTANRAAMENRVYGTEAYFDMRRINREAREAARRPPASPDDLARFARARAPSRLSVSELDPFSGQITWPVILQGPSYAEHRESLESLFTERAQTGHLNFQQQNELRTVTQDMEETLRNRIRDYPPQQYMQTKTFIEGLRAEMMASAT